LRFFGDWFGKPYDNYHIIVSSEAEGDMLSVGFNENERLTVWNPNGFVTDRKTFRIATAQRVRWEWYLYGRRRIPENLRFLDYLLQAKTVRLTTDFERHVPNPGPEAAAPAVEMV
jgi:hypothetical protein